MNAHVKTLLTMAGIAAFITLLVTFPIWTLLGMGVVTTYVVIYDTWTETN